jgi:galactosyl transferase GMA12/MNN10 family
MRAFTVYVTPLVVLVILLICNEFHIHFLFGQTTINKDCWRNVDSTTVVIPPPQTKVCIVQIDNRYQSDDLCIPNLGSLTELKSLYLRLKNNNSNQNGLHFWQLSLLLNKAYALRHGYTLLISNMTAYNTTLINTGLNPAWMKVHFIYDLQNQLSPTECEWFSFLDSDSFFWMDGHRLSLDDFFATASVHEVSLDYDERESARQAMRGYLPWQNQSQVFMIGQNGQYDHEDLGNLKKRLDPKGDFACTGVWFVKNSDLGREIMRQWRDGTDQSLETRQVLRKFRHHVPWEQRGFTRLLYPKFQTEISIFPFRDFNKRDGRVIRHVWTQFGHERIPRMIQALDEIFKLSIE